MQSRVIDVGAFVRSKQKVPSSLLLRLDKSTNMELLF